ncbi:rho guanine nucleotide exchange factor 10-like protein [Lampris incognitus]|uniref:rho guanine nucleotide exchange factor 10-like protein n=1 Tax=Lampris incognitus TaxID=2546036 RepID=UPI0024B536F7|nr:rho guanine nucleotide exchange factor 10-like protein [Lampris incognitus]
MKAARNGTKDSLQKTKSAMMRKISFLRRKDHAEEGREDVRYMNVFLSESKHPLPELKPMPAGLSSQQMVRRLILGSIVQSERSYLDSLKRVLQDYEKPLLQPETRVLSPKKVRQIFYRLQEIHQCHSMFQIALASRVADWDQSEKIGDLFVASFSKSMVLDVYSDYVNNFMNAMTLIKKACISNPAFLDFLKKKQASNPDRITLYGLMVKPIQRFPQFILLLQDMLKNTPRNHPDRLPLQLAITELETLAEKLNQQKHLAEQLAEVQQLALSIGDQDLNKVTRYQHSQLIQSEVLIETVYGEQGQVVKSKERKVFLLNDMLVCASVTPKGGSDISNLVPGLKYSVKWVAPLLQTQVVEVGQEDTDGLIHLRGKAKTLSSSGVAGKPLRRFTPPSRMPQWKTLPLSGKVFIGPPRLYQELEELQHDLSVVEAVTLLVGTLHGTYQNLNTTVSQDWCLALQRLIQIKEEEIQCANKCCLRLSVPAKPDKSGHAVSFMVVFNTPSPLSKICWVNRIHLAKIAQREENRPGWDFTEDDDEGRIKAPFRLPLLACRLPVSSTKAQQTKLAAALYVPAQCALLGFCTASTSLPQGQLWVGSRGDGSCQGQVKIFSLNRSTPRMIKSIKLGAPVLCLEYITEPIEQKEYGQTTSKLGSTICLGLQDGNILVYGSVDTYVQSLQTFFSPEGRPVVCLKHAAAVLFAGLANGKVAVYRRKTGERLWDIASCRSVALGSAPVGSLLTLEDTVWASCANSVTVIQVSSLHTLSFEAHPESAAEVCHMVGSGGGVWMAFTHSSSIHLFHTETLDHLQEINISTCFAHLTVGHGSLCVTSLLICQGLLWVGTTQGAILTFPVPTLEGIPKIRGKGMMSLNAHNGPVDFLVPILSTLSADTLKRDSLCSGSFQGSDGEEGGEEMKGGEDDAVEQDMGSCPPVGSPTRERSKGVLLQYHLRSTSQLPGVLLMAKPHQELHEASPELPEQSPEDSTIYELSEKPNVWVRGGPVEKEVQGGHNKFTSAAVISGGRGYRRVRERTSAENRLDSIENTLLVWQLPLALSP